MIEIRFRTFKITILDTNKSSSFYELIDKNRNRLEAFFAGTVAKMQTLDDTEAYCNEIKQLIKDKLYFPFIISSINDDTFIGLIDIKNINWSIPKAEIGYFIDHEYEGQGIISEGLGLLVDGLVGKYKFKKLLCRANSENAGSINVALKNGFELEGTIRRDYKTTDGVLVDLNYYGRIF